MNAYAVHTLLNKIKYNQSATGKIKKSDVNEFVKNKYFMFFNFSNSFQCFQCFGLQGAPNLYFYKVSASRHLQTFIFIRFWPPRCSPDSPTENSKFSNFSNFFNFPMFFNVLGFLGGQNLIRIKVWRCLEAETL